MKKFFLGSIEEGGFFNSTVVNPETKKSKALQKHSVLKVANFVERVGACGKHFDGQYVSFHLYCFPACLLSRTLKKT